MAAVERSREEGELEPNRLFRQVPVLVVGLALLPGVPPAAATAQEREGIRARLRLRVGNAAA